MLSWCFVSRSRLYQSLTCSVSNLSGFSTHLMWMGTNSAFGHLSTVVLPAYSTVNTVFLNFGALYEQATLKALVIMSLWSRFAGLYESRSCRKRGSHRSLLGMSISSSSAAVLMLSSVYLLWVSFMKSALSPSLMVSRRFNMATTVLKDSLCRFVPLTLSIWGVSLAFSLAFPICGCVFV